MHIAGTSRWRPRMLSRGGHCCCRCYRESQHSCTARESGSEPWMLRNNLEHKLIMKTPFNLDTRHPVQATIRTLSISYRDDNREIWTVFPPLVWWSSSPLPAGGGVMSVLIDVTSPVSRVSCVMSCYQLMYNWFSHIFVLTTQSKHHNSCFLLFTFKAKQVP